MTIDTILFDLGNVLLQWDRHHLYRKLIPDDVERQRFLDEVCTQAWNELQDEGRSTAEGTAALTAQFPQHADLIGAFYSRFDEMIPGPIPGMPEIVAKLAQRGIPLYGLSNWTADTFHHAESHDVVKTLKSIVVSGREKVMKPDPRIFQIAIERFSLVPERTLFVDDLEKNIAAGEAMGLRGHVFKGADGLRQTLDQYGLL